MSSSRSNAHFALMAAAGWIAVDAIAILAPGRTCDAWSDGLVFPLMFLAGALAAIAAYLSVSRRSKPWAIALALPVAVLAAGGTFFAMVLATLAACEG